MCRCNPKIRTPFCGKENCINEPILSNKLLDKNPVALINKIRHLSLSMRDTAIDIEYYEGFNAKANEKARELLNAAIIIDGWAQELEMEE